MTVSRETLLNEYFKERPEQVERYAELLATWGIERGLVGPKEADRIWDRHIANCIPLSTLIPNEATVVDIGSGAGLPGLVLALARPDLVITLVEPLQRRVDFLNEVIGVLEIPVEVVRGKSESVKRRFQVVTARAVAPLPKLIDISWHLVASEGTILAMKGEGAQSEIEATTPKKNSTITLHTLELPDFDLARVIEVRKTG